MKKILVVEDDLELSRGICYALQKEGYESRKAYSLGEAKESWEEEEADLILLDVNLPDGEGFAFCKWVQERKKIPVLFLTARDLEEDALLGFEAGAQDYVTKPFSMKILLRKIQVVLDRAAGYDRMERELSERSLSEQNLLKQNLWEDGYLKIDFDRVKMEVQGEERNLTPTEFRLLKELVTHKNQLLTYEVLLDRLWDSDGQFVDRHALAVNVNRLRGKIEDEEHKYISNVYGMGYQWLGV